MCFLISEVCVQVVPARKVLHTHEVTAAVLPLLSSSAEEVQEAAARALEKIARLPAIAISARRQEGVQPVVDLMASKDESVQLAAICAARSLAHSDPKAAAAIRDADGFKPLLSFLASKNTDIQVSACQCVLGCSRNEANKTILREMGAITLLLKMLPASTNGRDAQAAAVHTLAYLTLNEDEARVLLRLQGGMEKLQKLLRAPDPLIQAHAAEVIAHCAPNKESRIALRLSDGLCPLVELLSSPHVATRNAAARALMQGTQVTRTNQVKCRELGAISPLLKLLEPPEEGEPDTEAQRCSLWTLSNVCCELTAARQLRQSPSGFAPLIIAIDSGDALLQRPAAACLFNVTTSDLGAPIAIENTGGLPALSKVLLYAEGSDGKPAPWDEDNTWLVELIASAGGILLNCAAKRSMAAIVASAQPELLSRLLVCVHAEGFVPAVGNAAGAIMNLCAGSEACVAELLATPSKVDALFEVLPAMRDEWPVQCHIAGIAANLCVGGETGRALLCAAAKGEAVRLLVETLEGSEDDSQSCACCVALLNACHQHQPSRELLLDCGGVQALVTALASDNLDVKTAAAGALLNASATAGCAEAIREAGIEAKEKADGSSSSAVSAFELLSRCLHGVHNPMLRSRAAGALFNCAAFGPDTRLAMLEAGVASVVTTAVVNAFSADPAKSATGRMSLELNYRIKANLIGCVLNLALNPTCKAELLKQGILPPLVEALKSPDEAVQSQASTAIAYLSDKAEPRPGSPISTMSSAEDPAALTKTKLRFHETGAVGAGSGVSAVSYLHSLSLGAGGGGGTSGATEGATVGSDLAVDVSAEHGSPKAVTEIGAPPVVDEDAPGGRTKVGIGLMPKAKVSATHDSKSKLPRFVQERPETYGRRMTEVVEPQNIEDEYVEVPSPLPSPRMAD